MKIEQAILVEKGKANSFDSFPHTEAFEHEEEKENNIIMKKLMNLLKKMKINLLIIFLMMFIQLRGDKQGKNLESIIHS